MYNILIITLLICIIASPAHNALAFRDNDVRYTVHNLSYDPTGTHGLDNTQRNQYATDPGGIAPLTEVCIFCHTPHNASPSVPLWNKAYDSGIASTYKLYTSSASLSSKAKAATITANSPSMLCLSCHDGKSALNVLHNAPTSSYDSTSSGDPIIAIGGEASDKVMALADFAILGSSVQASNIGAVRGANGKIMDDAGARNGTNLTDDHPIGFSYAEAQAEKGDAALHPLATAKTNGLRFFGPGRDRMECSSCHNPHAFYGYGRNGSFRVAIAGATAAQIEKTPFLNISNNGSAMCLGCHNK